MSKFNKVERLANNVQIMLKSETPRSLCINQKNERAFQLAVKQLGMRLDEFEIVNDFPYLEIRLKQDVEKSKRIALPLLKRPRLPQNKIRSSGKK